MMTIPSPGRAKTSDISQHSTTRAIEAQRGRHTACVGEPRAVLAVAVSDDLQLFVGGDDHRAGQCQLALRDMNDGPGASRLQGRCVDLGLERRGIIAGIGIDLEDLAMQVRRRGRQREIRRRHRIPSDEVCVDVPDPDVASAGVYVDRARARIGVANERLVVRPGGNGRAAITHSIADHVVDQEPRPGVSGDHRVVVLGVVDAISLNQDLRAPGMWRPANWRSSSNRRTCCRRTRTIPGYRG